MNTYSNVAPLWQRYAVASQHIKKKEKEMLEKKCDTTVQRCCGVAA
jgi:hypothetical protein